MVEFHVANVAVAGSNPVSRSRQIPAGLSAQRDLAKGGGKTLTRLGGLSFGAVAKWLRRRSAKPLFSGSNPLGASPSAFGEISLCGQTPDPPGW